VYQYINSVVVVAHHNLTDRFAINGFDFGAEEVRGRSFSIGGDNGSITVPSFIKQFNDKLYGATY
jgi:hypothetical protein